MIIGENEDKTTSVAAINSAVQFAIAGINQLTEYADKINQ